MLNAGNLALIAFARQLRNADGQIFALTVMVVAAAEAVLGLGLIVTVSREHAALDVDRLTSLRGWMEVLAWIALFSPTVAVVAVPSSANGSPATPPACSRPAPRSSRSSAASPSSSTSSGRTRTTASVLTSAWAWLTAGTFHVDASLLIDPLSVFMMLVVSGVGFLILSYAIGYMHGDEEERRYRAYKALFIFSMLLLVMAGNLLWLLAGYRGWSDSPPTC